MFTPQARALGALTIWTSLYLVVGLIPFDFHFHDIARPRVYPVSPINGMLNFIFFLPFGILICGLKVQRPILVAGLFCGMLSLSVEILQLFIPGRFTTLPDLILNTFGGMSGAFLGRRRESKDRPIHDV